MNKNNKIISSMLLLTIIILLGFNFKPNSPNKSSFPLTVHVSKKVLKVGETLNVKATFQNLSIRNLKLEYGSDEREYGLGDKDIIKLYVVHTKDVNKLFATAGWGREINIKGMQEITRSKNYKMDKSGKYIIYACVGFNIKDLRNEKFSITTDKIVVQVNPQ